MRHPIWRVLAGLVVLGLVGGGVVWQLRPDERIELTATFDDVVDLVPAAHVRAADVPIGTIAGIELTDEHRAEVTMSVRPGTGLPRQVVAVLRQTSLLGERYVELRPAEGAAGSLADGGEVVGTAAVADLEDLVSSGNTLLAPVAAGQLADAVAVGASSFAGRGSAIGTLLDDLGAAVGDYTEGRDAIVDLIDASDRLLTTLAEDAEINAGVLADLAEASEALEAEDDRLLDALRDLSRLADVGARVLRTNRDPIDDLVTRLHRVAGELTRIDGALGDVLRWFRRHNLHVPGGVLDEQSQVWNDFLVCGSADEEDGNPAADCTPPNPGESNDPPPDYAPDDCDLHHDGCPYPEGQDAAVQEDPANTDGEPGDGGEDG